MVEVLGKIPLKKYMSKIQPAKPTTPMKSTTPASIFDEEVMLRVRSKG
jgi:hypothetical protein